MGLQKIIRQSADTGVTSALEQFSLNDYRSEGLKIIDAAKRKAAEIIRKAKDMLDSAERLREDAKRFEMMAKLAKEEEEKIRAEASEKGRGEGLEIGRREGVELGQVEGAKAAREEAFQQALSESKLALQEEIGDAVRIIESILGVVETEREKLIKESRATLVRLAVAVAEKIIKREIALDPEIIKYNVIRAVDLAMQEAQVTIRVNPTDREVLEKFLPRLVEQFAKVDTFHLETAEEITQGGCEIKSGEGLVDMKLETQLAEIERQLLGE